MSGLQLELTDKVPFSSLLYGTWNKNRFPNIFLMNGFSSKNWTRHWPGSASGTGEGHGCFLKLSLCNERYIHTRNRSSQLPAFCPVPSYSLAYNLRYVNRITQSREETAPFIVPCFLVDHQLYGNVFHSCAMEKVLQKILLILRWQTIIFVRVYVLCWHFFQQE